MVKKLFLFTFILFLAFANSALAHTGLESSTPQNGDIVNEELKQITLTFEGKVEQSSTFELQNSTGESIPVENISLSENQIVGNLSNPLENGEYQVNWNIIGADGHPIEGEFSFSVDVPVTGAPAEEPTETSTDDQVETQEEAQEGTIEQSNVDETEVDTTNEASEEEFEQNESSSNVMPIIIGILIVIVIGSFLFMKKRKK